MFAIQADGYGLLYELCKHAIPVLSMTIPAFPTWAEYPDVYKLAAAAMDYFQVDNSNGTTQPPRSQSELYLSAIRDPALNATIQVMRDRLQQYDNEHVIPPHLHLRSLPTTLRPLDPIELRAADHDPSGQLHAFTRGSPRDSRDTTRNRSDDRRGPPRTNPRSDNTSALDRFARNRTNPDQPTAYRLACSPCAAPEPPPPWGITLSDEMDDPYFDTPLPISTHRAACTALGASTARRLESELTLHPVMHLARVLPPTAHSGQLDIGANYSVTAHRSLLTNYRPFSQPIPMDSIDASGTTLRCLGSGIYRVTDSHGQSFHIPMWYCPGVSETLIAPDHVCRESTQYTIVDSHHDVASNVGHLRFSSPSSLSTRELPLIRANGLW
jgi:hypothetical protein